MGCGVGDLDLVTYGFHLFSWFQMAAALGAAEERKMQAALRNPEFFWCIHVKDLRFRCLCCHPEGSSGITFTSYGTGARLHGNARSHTRRMQALETEVTRNSSDVGMRTNEEELNEDRGMCFTFLVLLDIFEVRVFGRCCSGGSIATSFGESAVTAAQEYETDDPDPHM